MGRSAADCDDPEGEELPVPRVAVYTRVSTADQVTGTSLSTQFDPCTTYARVRGWSIVAVSTDNGVSAVAATRPGLGQLIAAIDRDNITMSVKGSITSAARAGVGPIQGHEKPGSS